MWPQIMIKWYDQIKPWQARVIDKLKPNPLILKILTQENLNILMEINGMETKKRNPGEFESI